jgi:hypothetical protein
MIPYSFIHSFPYTNLNCKKEEKWLKNFGHIFPMKEITDEKTPSIKSFERRREEADGKVGKYTKGEEKRRTRRRRKSRRYRNRINWK